MDKAHRVDDDGAQVRTALSAALKNALRGRDIVAASALRSALSTIGNRTTKPWIGAQSGVG